MRLIAVSGIQGSGKTSLIKSFIRYFASKGFSSGIIINEDGDAKYDPAFLKDGNIRIEGLSGGWLGCSLAASFAQLIKGFCKTNPPDYLFIEPSGLVTTEELLAASRTGLRDCSYELGPFITLLNAEDFSFNWQERRSLLISQITGAGLVCVTKIDGVSDAELASLKNAVLPYTKNLTEIVPVNGQGTQRLFSLVEDLATSPGGNGSNG